MPSGRNLHTSNPVGAVDDDGAAQRSVRPQGADDHRTPSVASSTGALVVNTAVRTVSSASPGACPPAAVPAVTSDLRLQVAALVAFGHRGAGGVLAHGSSAELSVFGDLHHIRHFANRTVLDLMCGRSDTRPSRMVLKAAHNRRQRPH